MASFDSILHDVEVVAKIAAPFVPPPYNIAVNALGGFAGQTNNQLVSQNIQLPNISTLIGYIPPDILQKILNGEKITLEIDGGKIRDGVKGLLSHLGDAVKVK